MKRILLGCFFLLTWSSILYAQTPFYHGKTITLIAGTTAGSQYDAHARLIAQHWGKHIPGNPEIIVQTCRGRFFDRGEPSLQRGQARRSDGHVHHPIYLFQSAGRTQRGPVRLLQIQLDRQRGPFRQSYLYALRYTV